MATYNERNTELFKRYKDGDIGARSLICEENLGLVKKIVSGFTKYSDINEDLINTGIIGLLKAIDNFDLSFNVQFSTYAVPMILGEIKRFLRDDGIIKVSRQLKSYAAKGFSAREMLKNKLNREPTIKEISAECKISVEDLTCAFDAVREPESLNRTAYDDTEEEFIDKISEGFEEEKIIDKITIEHILKNVTERERKILVLRYLKGKTQEDIAKVIGVSQVQVSRIEKKALQRIREEQFS